MSNHLKATRLVNALLGEEGPDDYLNKLGIVRTSPKLTEPETKNFSPGPNSITSQVLKGDPFSEDDMDAEDLVQKWAEKRLRTRSLRHDNESVEALLNDLGTDLEEYLDHNEDVYSLIIEQIMDEIQRSKDEPDGWYALVKSVVNDENTEGADED